MIYTLTLNPSVDYHYYIEGDIVDGEVNRTLYESFSVGGKGINVSNVLGNLGIDSTALGFVAGKTGDIILSDFKEKHMKEAFIVLKEGMTRICASVKGKKETQFNPKGPLIREEDMLLLYKKLSLLKKDDILIMSGSLPRGISSSAYSQIMKGNKKVRYVVDASGEALKEALKEKPFLIKPNLSELNAFFNENCKTRKDIIPFGKILRKMGAENVIISLGKEGAMLFDSHDKIYFQESPEGKVRHTVGSGDSLVAGFIYKALNNASSSEALKFAVSSGSASAFSENYPTKKEIISLYEKMKESIIIE